MNNSTVVGSIGCPGIDPEAWQLKNRAPIYPGKVNRWILAAAVKSDSNESDLMNDLHALFWTWFGEPSGGPSEARIWIFADHEFQAGNADNIRIVTASPTEKRLEDPAAKREGLPGPIPSINASAKSLIYVELSFSYRGQASDIAWPVFSNSAWTKGGKVCPVNADWVLIDVAKPEADAPPERTIAERITEGSAEVLKKGASSIASGLGFDGTITIAVAAALGIWLYTKLK